MLKLGDLTLAVTLGVLLSYALYLLVISQRAPWVEVVNLYLIVLSTLYLYQLPQAPYLLSLKILSLITLMVLFQYVKEIEFVILCLLTLYGIFLFVTADHFILFYISLEFLSLGSYVLAAYDKNRESTEAGLKYFVLGSLGSGFLVFGLTLIYGLTGVCRLSELCTWSEYSQGVISGVIFVLVGLLFKLGGAPFHNWLPDVYEGSPTVVTMFFAVIPKWAMVLMLVRWCEVFGYVVQPLLLMVAALSMMIGTIGGWYQQRMKRWLAYSSLNHVGFVVLGAACESVASQIYVGIYVLTNVVLWSFLLSSGKKNPLLTEFHGMATWNRTLAALVGVALFSSVGVPPLAGFLSKLVVFRAVMMEGNYGMVILGLALSIIAAAYYLRMVQTLYFRQGVMESYDMSVINSYVIPLSSLVLVVIGLVALNASSSTGRVSDYGSEG